MNLSEFDSKIRRTNRLVFVVFVCVLGAYFGWFYLIYGKSLSTATSAWGEFGDFAGGLLNPFIALCAYYWLTQSVRLQKDEMSKAYEALKESAKAQNDMLGKYQAYVDAVKDQTIAQDRQNLLMRSNLALQQSAIFIQGQSSEVERLNIDIQFARTIISELDKSFKVDAPYFFEGAVYNGAEKKSLLDMKVEWLRGLERNRERMLEQIHQVSIMQIVKPEDKG